MSDYFRLILRDPLSTEKTHHYSHSKLDQMDLESGGVVYTTSTIVFLHSIFLLQMTPLTQVIFALTSLSIIAYKGQAIVKNRNFLGSLICLGFLSAYSYVLVILGQFTNSNTLSVLFSFSFAAIAYVATTRVKVDTRTLVLSLAHMQVFVALYRLHPYVGKFSIAPLWTLYSFMILLYASSSKNLRLAQNAIPLIFIALGKFVFFDFPALTGVERIVALVIMGILIYLGGYLYRSVSSPKLRSST